MRFLGVLLHTSVYPLPTIAWHWNYPPNLPASAAPNFPVKSVLAHMTFKRYWQYLAMPGFLGGEDGESEPVEAGNTEGLLYR